MSDTHTIADTLLRMDAANKSIQRTKEDLHACITGLGGELDFSLFSAYATAIAGLPTPPLMGLSYVLSLATFVTSTEPTTGAVKYVVPGGAGSKDGSSWSNAYATRQAAVNASASGGRVYVQEGTYVLTANQVPKTGVSEYYGFTSSGLWEDRNPYLHPSKHDANGTAYTYRQLTTDFTATQVLDGFWIQNSVSASYLGVHASKKLYGKNLIAYNCYGGGLGIGAGSLDGFVCMDCTYRSGLTLSPGVSASNGVVYRCSAPNGGGIVKSGAGTVSNCLIIGCRADTYGGGICMAGQDSGSLVGTVSNCTVICCTAGVNGGGISTEEYNSNQYVYVNYCTVISCSAGTLGGGIFISGYTYYGPFTCAVFNCQAGSSGGGIYITGGTAGNSNSLIDACTVVNCNAQFASGICADRCRNILNNVTWNCSLGFNYRNLAYQIKSCASNVQLEFDRLVSMSDVSVSGFVTLTSSPFIALPKGLLSRYTGLPDGASEDSPWFLNFIELFIRGGYVPPRISASSPLALAGFTYPLNLPLDLAGATRPKPPSIGAYEVQE